MGTHSTKADENMYFLCRRSAAKYDERLRSRDGAAELLGISASSLADYELGNTKVVPVDKVVLMADRYRSPELRVYYCRNVCPLGADCMPQLEIAELDRLTIKVVSSLRQISYIENTLLDVVADGEVSSDEKPKLQEVLKALDSISTYSQELKLWAEKNLK